MSHRNREPRVLTGDPLPADTGLARVLADWIDAWSLCGRGPCIRARRCRAEGTPCFPESLEELVGMLGEDIAFHRICDRLDEGEAGEDEEEEADGLW